MNRLYVVALLGGTSLLAACAAVGRDYQAPSIGLTSQFVEGEPAPAGVVIADRWWLDLNDPRLTMLIERGLAQNLDIQTALARVEEAEATLRGTGAPDSSGGEPSFEIAGAPSSISRLDRERNITLSVELNGRALGEVNAEAQQLATYQNLPAGVTVTEGGELEQMSEMFVSFGTAMAIGIFCIYGVLVLLFKDFLQPVTILAALPLSLGGALAPLVLTGTAFSMPAVIGLLMLMGIVTKNSILLVEYAIMARRKGMSRYEALIDACHKRARPIVMTTIAMAGGMLPVAMNWAGGDAGFRQPMAYVVIGGLLTSTVLSLVVIPVIFTYIDDLLGLLGRLVGHPRLQDASVPDAPPTAS